MKSDAAQQENPGAEAWQTARPSWRVRLATAWLNFFFFLAAHFPGVMLRLAGLLTGLCWWVTIGLRDRAARQAARLLGPGASAGEIRRLGCGILKSFYLFVCDVARSRHQTLPQIRERIESVTGREHYDRARAMRRGLIAATAHLGSFEVGVAALRDREERIHIVFQSDRLSAFDALRSELHDRLGVQEARVDAGWDTWVGLRDALGRDEIVLMQSDRVMPGQQGVPVPFAGHSLMLPLGIVKLARLTGAPILPIYAIRRPDGRVCIEIDPPIEVSEADAVPPGEAPPSLLKIARSLENRVMRYPEQWLVLHDVWAGPSSVAKQA